MATYTATFKDGTQVTRTSKHAYVVAWRATWVVDGAVRSDVGFSASAEKVSAYCPAPYGVTGGTAKQRAEAKRKNAEFQAASRYSVEIAPAIAA